MSTDKKNQNGFTIVELLIATAVFSVVLLVFLSAFLQVSELFYKGVNLSNTQETARNVIQNISDDIQFYHSPPDNFTASSPPFFCIGSHRYTYKLGVQYTPGGSNYGLLRENIAGGCVSPATQAPNVSAGQELLDPGMQLNRMNIACTGGLCSVGIHLVFYAGDTAVLYSPSNDSRGFAASDAECTGPASSAQYCATADYTKTILQSY